MTRLREPALHVLGIVLVAALAMIGLRVLRSGRPNVVLICIDALRADATSPYNPQIRHTPNLQSLADEGTVVPLALSQSSWTTESIASVMTGRLPGEVAAGQGPLSIAESETTLPELLRQRGYATAAVVANSTLTEADGFAQGFDWFSNESLGPGLPERLTRWLTDHRRKPFFLYLHYMQAHHPYRWPEKFEAMVGPLPPHIRDMRSKEIVENLVWSLRAGEGHVTGEEARYLRRCYDAAVATADEAVGAVFSYLKAHDLWSPTLVILFADHGEEFAEHGMLQHSADLYREEIRVPLLLKLPRGGRQRTPVHFARNLDIAPTLAEIAGLRRRMEWRGVSLFSKQAPEIALAELGVRTHPDPFVASRTTHWRAVYLSSGESLVQHGHTGKLGLYGAADPEQQHDVADQHPDRVRELAHLLPTARARGGTTAPLSETQKRTLRSLGYMR